VSAVAEAALHTARTGRAAKNRRSTTLTKIRLILIATATGIVLAGPRVASAATAPEAKRFHGIGEQAKRLHGIAPDAKRFHGVQANGYKG